MYLKLLLLLSSAFLWNVGLSSQVKIVQFKVDMNYQIEQGNFDAAINFVDIAGSFNEWNGENHRLEDDDKDNIYQISISDFNIGQEIEFKFRIDGQWDGQEEFPGGGPNRSYKIIEGNNIVDVWYNDEVPNDAPFKISFSAANTSIQTGSLLHFTNLTTGSFTNAQWTFEGGIPTTSKEINPKIRYDESGSYDVSLEIESADQKDSFVLKDFIHVSERSEEELDWWNDAVFYEIFIRSFKDSDGDGIGDINGIVEKLDYLNDGDPTTDKDLGVSAIWLMPIHPSPSYHGYDVTDYNAINPDYGSIEDFSNLIEEAHKRGIKVIIDFVMNHSSSDHPWFVDAKSTSSSTKRNWYSWRSIQPNQSGPWGQDVWHNSPSGYYYGLFWSGMPDLNFNEPELREEIMSSVNYWLNEIGIDGLRLDAIKYIYEEENRLEDTEATFTFWKDFQREIKTIKNTAFSVGEAWTNTDQVVEYVQDGGLDICFEFDLASDIIAGVNSQDADRITERAQKIYNVYPNNQFGTFLTNHDMNRAIESLGHSSSKMKTAAAIYLNLPGTPFIYYGEEINMRGVKPDEFIRRPMQWSAELNAGFSNVTPWIALNNNYGMSNVSTQMLDPQSTLNHYDQLIQIRNDEVVLRRGGYESLPSSDSKVLSFNRYFDGTSIVVMINLSDQIVTANFDAQHTSLSEGLMSLENLMTGSTLNMNINDQKKTNSFTFDPREVLILKSTTTTPTTENVIADSKRITVWPSPVEDWLHVEIERIEGDVTFSILDMNGKTLTTESIQNGEAISVSNLNKGIYILQTRLDGTLYLSKFVKL